MRKLLLFLIALSATLVIVPAAQAVTINVTTAADTYGGSAGTCSLREAITAAQTDATFDGCQAGAGADEITLPAQEYKITRAGEEENLNVTGDFDVVGTGALTIKALSDQAKVVIDANGLDRAYDQQGNNSLSINSQQIKGGVLTAIGDDGAGIRNTVGTLTVEGVTISGNTTKYQGGAIAVYSNLSAVNSTFSGNSANGNGGALWIPGGATASVKSSTITANTADLDGDNNGNGGGFADGGATSINLLNTINAANTAPAANGPDCDSGPFYFPRYTIQIQPFAAGVCLTGFNPPTNKVVTDPLLGPLQDNGGQTPTHALLAGSPAIDAGAPGDVPGDACTATDQNGRERPAGNCDIGAVQFFVPPPPATFSLRFVKINPKPLKLKRGKKAKGVSITVKSTGSAAVLNVKVCLQPGKKAKKAIKLKGKFCGKIGTLVGSKTAKFKLAAKKKGKKGKYKIKAVLSGAGAIPKTGTVVVKVN
ncbi:MAG: choice-of-anchor Q domain-containing protein [Solirubrobacterales bacterium]